MPTRFLPPRRDWTPNMYCFSIIRRIHHSIHHSAFCILHSFCILHTDDEDPMVTSFLLPTVFSCLCLLSAILIEMTCTRDGRRKTRNLEIYIVMLVPTVGSVVMLFIFFSVFAAYTGHTISSPHGNAARGLSWYNSLRRICNASSSRRRF